MSERVGIQTLLNAARAAAERLQTDPAAAKAAFDAIGAAVGIDPFDLWNVIDDRIGRATDPALQEQLIAFRRDYVEKFVEAECARLDALLRQSPESGWNGFLLAMAEVITRFRFDFALRLCDHPFPFDEPQRRRQADIREALLEMHTARWPRAYRVLNELAGYANLPDALRARLLLILGQIQQFQFSNIDRAKTFYDQALALAPDNHRVVCGIADYYAASAKPDEARARYERAISIAPALTEGYVGMGEICEGSSDIAGAEGWYRKAIAADSGSVAPLSKLLRLYARPELYGAHAAELVRLMEHTIAVEPSAEYQAYLDLAYVYEQNGKVDEAVELYENALALDPRRPDGYTAFGQCYQEHSRPDDARKVYERAIEAVRNCYDAYRGLIAICDEELKPEEALQWRKKLEVAATSALPDAAGGDVTPVNALELLGVDYTKLGDAESARRVYDALSAALGPSYDGTYHNWLGNLHYYRDEDVEAAAEYERAIAASPNDPVFRRNLAGAYKILKRYDHAASEYRAALALDGDQHSFDRDMSLLLNGEANDLYAARNYDQAVEKYAAALELDAGDPVIWANLAGAWEEAGGAGGKAHAFGKALEALEHANNLEPSYTDRIASLGRKLLVARTYGEDALGRVHVVTPLVVEIAADLAPFVSGATEGSLSDEMLLRVDEMRANIERNLGVKVPGIQFRLSDADFASGFYVIFLREVPLVSGTIPADRRLFPGPASAIVSLGVAGEKAVNPQTNDEAVWVARENWGTLLDSDRALWDPTEYIARHLDAVIRRNLVEFVGHFEVAAMVRAEVPGIREELSGSEGKLSALTAVCAGLLSEGLPIKPLDQIYAVFDRLFSQRTPLHEIVEAIRSSVLRARVSAIDSRYRRLPLGERFEEEIARSIYRTDSHAVLAMVPDACSSALSAVREAVKDGEHALVVDNAALRPFVRLLTEFEFPSMPVLSRNELGTDAETDEAHAVELEATSGPHGDIAGPQRSRLPCVDEVDAAPEPADAEIGITVYVSSVFNASQAESDDRSLAEAFSMMQEGLFSELGVLVPEMRLAVDPALADMEFRFSINGRDYPKVKGLASDEYLVNDSVDRLAVLSVKARPSVNPANGNESAVVRESDMPSAQSRRAGLIVWGPLGYVVLGLSAAIRRNAASFQTVAATHYVLDKLEEMCPDLVRAALKRFSVEKICLVLRGFLEEEITIRDMRGILEGLLSVNGTTDVDMSRFIVLACHTDNLYPAGRGRELAGLTIAEYTDAARTAFKQYISYKYGRGGNSLHAYLLHPDIEERIRAAGKRPVTAKEIETLKAALRKELETLPPNTPVPALLTTMDVRRAARKLIADDFPNIPVLSYQELSSDISIQPLARLSWD